MQVREYPQMRIRLRPDIARWIDEEAKANRRTKNGEIEFALAERMKQKEAAAGDARKA